MLDRLFPKSFDNAYRGNRLAIWLLAAVVLLKAVQGFNSVAMTHLVMTNADGIPVDSFGPVAAQAATGMFALLGMYLLVLSALSAVALIRYRSMIPLIYLMWLVTHLGARAMSLVHPVMSGHPLGLYVNLGIVAILLVGFVLSLRTRSGAMAGVA